MKLREGWETVRLGDVCEFISRGITPVYTQEQNTIIINQKCIRENIVSLKQARYHNEEKKNIVENKKLKKHDILINSTGTGTLGRVALFKHDIDNITVDSHITIVRGNNKVNQIYLSYNLSVQQENIAALAEGSTGQTELSKTRLSECIEIPLPSLSEQRRIAGILSALDDKIELNSRMNKNLEAQAQAIFKSWFVDFDPWGGKMPNDWRIGTLGEIATITMGQSPKGDTYNEDGNGMTFYQGRAEFGTRFPTRRLFTTAPNRIASENDILLSVRAPVGDYNIATETCCIGRGLAAIKPFIEAYSYCLGLMFELQPKFNQFNGEGTVFGSINKDNLNGISILIPDSKILLKFENMISPLNNQIKFNYYNSRTLAALRDALLPKLMSGEINVKEVE